MDIARVFFLNFQRAVKKTDDQFSLSKSNSARSPWPYLQALVGFPQNAQTQRDDLTGMIYFSLPRGVPRRNSRAGTVADPGPFRCFPGSDAACSNPATPASPDYLKDKASGLR
jgi:hypothetical protein